MSKAKEAPATTEIATLEGLFGSKEQMPAEYMDAGRGLGNEDVSKEDIAIPQIKLLQPLSPEVEEIEGAKAGVFLNTLTGEMTETLIVSNLKFQKEYSVFKKRALGKGFFGAFPSESAALAHVSTLPGTPNDYEITETCKHYLMVLNPQTGECKHPAVYFMTGTARQPSRVWNASLADVNKGGDRFISAWRLSVEKRKNDKGTWYLPKIEHLGYLKPHVYAECKAFFGAAAANDDNFDNAVASAA